MLHHSFIDSLHAEQSSETLQRLGNKQALATYQSLLGDAMVSRWTEDFSFEEKPALPEAMALWSNEQAALAKRQAQGIPKLEAYRLLDEEEVRRQRLLRATRNIQHALSIFKSYDPAFKGLFNKGHQLAFDDVQAAYRRIARQHHSDRTGGTDQVMKRVNLAYERLKSIYQPRKKH